MRKQRLLIVDDSSFVRRMLQDWVEREPDLEVVGVAKNGQEGVELARQLKPDVVTLDVEMPELDGLQALPEIVRTGAAALMVSSVTTSGAQKTLKALESGAYDFVTKPQGSSSIKFVEAKEEILTKIRVARYAKGSTERRSVVPTRNSQNTSDKVVIIASSTGGPKTLRALFQALPAGFPAPIVIVQHMPASFTPTLAQRLNDLGTVPCQEATGGDVLVPGQAYIAPGGVHLEVGRNRRLQTHSEPNLHGVRPAADYLFKTAASTFGNKVVGVVLTGMGRDGAEGAAAIRKAGGTVYGESEASCVIYGMPKAAKDAGGIDAEFDLEELPAAIVGSVSKGAKRAS